MILSKPLIIAEKPSAARAIAGALGGFQRKEGYLESPDWAIAWCYGHLVELGDAEDYDPAYKRWRLEHLPILPEQFRLKALPRAAAQLRLIERLSRNASFLVNACDAGREGELIFGYICRKLGLTQPAKRLWVSSLTAEAIREGFRRLRPEEEFQDLYLSAECRSQGDWLTGINGTRAFTRRFDELLSIGRVQTPTLAMVVRREREIQAFQARPYWEVFATFRVPPVGAPGLTPGGVSEAAPGGLPDATPVGVYVGKWFGAEDRLWERAMAEEVAAKVDGRPGGVEKFETRETSEKPPGLFDLTTLQRECNRRFGLTASATARAAQELYETRLITYPRTDSRYLTRDLVPTLPRVLRGLSAVAGYRELVHGADPSRVGYGNRRVVDDARVTDHHAIIPTGEGPGTLLGAAQKVYDAVTRRFLAQFYPDAVFRETEVITNSEGERFRTHQKSPLTPGWTVVEGTGKSQTAVERAAELPPGLGPGTAVEVAKVDVQERETQPPKRYTEGTLLAAMEAAGREIEDEALREAMKRRGLGTPATRAAIIERLKEVGYLLAEKRVLKPAEKGCALIDRVERVDAGILLSPELTGEWEKRIADIQAGAYDPSRFLAEIRQMVRQLVAQVKNAAAVPSASTVDPGPSVDPGSAGDPGELGKCPACGRSVLKASRGWACSNPDCDLTIPGYLCGKVLDASLVRQLLSRGATRGIAGFKSKAGKPFSAVLVLEKGRVEFRFPDRKRRTNKRRVAKPK